MERGKLKFPWNEPNRYNLNPWPMRLVVFIGLLIVLILLKLIE